MTLADDGRGFDQAGTSPGAGSHLGMLGMRERASLLDGRCEVLSTPGKGTVVAATVPLQRGPLAVRAWQTPPSASLVAEPGRPTAARRN
jgi:signal transduction histidine kinase